MLQLLLARVHFRMAAGELHTERKGSRVVEKIIMKTAY